MRGRNVQFSLFLNFLDFIRFFNGVDDLQCMIHGGYGCYDPVEESKAGVISKISK